MPEFVDVEAVVVGFLRDATGLQIHTKVPKTRPARFTRAWRTGGPAINRVLERAQITVTCEADAATQAEADARACRNAFHNRYLRMPLVRGVGEVSGTYFDPDPDTGRDRYTFTVELTVRAHRN